MIQKSNTTPIAANPLVILFNLEAIEVSITNLFDPEKHILLEQKGQGLFTVIKNKSRLLQLANTLQKIVSENTKLKQPHAPTPVIVSYSPKSFSSVRQKLLKLSPFLAHNIVYFNLSNSNSHIRPNRAFLSYNELENIHEISYGGGYSQVSSFQELRLAIDCVFGLHNNQDQMFIIETDKGYIDKQKDIHKSGYKHLWSLNNFDRNQDTLDSLQSAVCKILQSLKDHNINHLGQNSQTSVYLLNLSKSLKPEDFKEVTSNVQIRDGFLIENLCPVKILGDFIKYPKKNYTPTPKSSIRSPNSKEVCSLIFKNMSDHKLYLSKSSVPKDIGGLYSEELIQNRCFMSMVPNLFHVMNGRGHYSLPLQKGYSMMKHSLLKQYETKKACTLIKPYLQGLVTVDKHADEFMEMVKSKECVFEGLGEIIFWSLVCNESFLIKTLLEQLTLVRVTGSEGGSKIQQQQNKNTKGQYLTQKYSNLCSFVSSSNTKIIKLLRTDCFEPFSTQSHSQLQISANKISQKNTKDLVIQFTRKHQILLKDLPIYYLKEMYTLALLVARQSEEHSPLGETFLKGLSYHYKWEFDRTDAIDSLVAKALTLKYLLSSVLKKLNPNHHEMPASSPVSRHFIKQISTKNPLQLLLLLPRDYARFIRPSTPEQNPFYEMMPKAELSLENRYVTAILHKTHSFQIHGNSPAIFSLPNWIRSLGHKHRFIEYMSLLTHTKEDYILMGKKMKIMATNEKMNALLIVDHCELCEQIMDEAKNVRTIFVSRFKKGEHEMQVMVDEDEEREEKYLKDSSDELIMLLLEVYEREMQGESNQKKIQQVLEKSVKKVDQGGLFKKYKFVLQSYIGIKSELYGFDCESVKNFSLSLHKNIAQSKNRHKEVMERYKEREEWKYIYGLPLEKKNQKLTFVKNLHGFIDVLKFVQMVDEERKKRQSIIKTTENPKTTMTKETKDEKRQAIEMVFDREMVKIDQKSLQYIREWAEYIEEDIKQQVVETLQVYITPLAHYPASTYLRSEKLVQQFSLVLQVLKILLLDNSQLQNKLFPQQQTLCHYPGQSVIKVQQLPILIVGTQIYYEKSYYYLVHTSHKIVVYSQNNGDKMIETQGEYDDVQGWVEVRGSLDANETRKTIKLIVTDKKQHKIISHKIISHQIISSAVNQPNQFQKYTQQSQQYTQQSEQNTQQDTDYYQVHLEINPFQQMNITLTKIISNNQNMSKSSSTISLKTLQLDLKQFISAQIIEIKFNQTLELKEEQSQNSAQNIKGYMLLLVIARQKVFMVRVNLQVKDLLLCLRESSELDWHKLVDLEDSTQLLRKKALFTVRQHNEAIQKIAKHFTPENKVQPLVRSFVLKINIKTTISAVVNCPNTLSAKDQSPLLFAHTSLNKDRIHVGLLMSNTPPEIECAIQNNINQPEQSLSPELLLINFSSDYLNSLYPKDNSTDLIQTSVLSIIDLISLKTQPHFNIYLHSIHFSSANHITVWYSLIDGQQKINYAFSTKPSYINSLLIQLENNSPAFSTSDTHFLDSIPFLEATQFLPLKTNSSSMITLTDTLPQINSGSNQSFVRLWKMDTKKY